MDIENFKMGDPVVSIEFDENGDIMEIEPDKVEEEITEEESTEETGVEESIDDQDTVKNDTEDSQEVEDEIDDSESTDTEESTDNPYQAFASKLIEDEILLSLEEGENIETEEDLVNHVSKTRDYLVEDIIKEANTKSYGAVDFFLNGGTPEEFAKQFGSKPKSVLNYKEEDITDNEDIQREVLENYYKKTTKFNDKKIKKLIDNDIDLGEPDEILEAYNKLVELDKEEKEAFKQESEARKVKQRKQQEQFNRSMQENTLNTSEFIPGRKLKKDVKEKVLNNIPDTWKKVNEDLSKYAPILSYLDYYGLLDGKFDKVIKEVETKQTSKLGDVLSKTKLSRKGDRIVKKTKEEEDRIKILRNSTRGVLD